MWDIRSWAMVSLVFCCFIGGLMGCVRTSGDRQDVDETAYGRAEAQFQSLLDKVVGDEENPVSGAVLRVKVAGEVWDLASGVRDVQSGALAREQDKFRCGSVIKPFVSAVVLQLVEEGKLSLDAKIVDLLPDKYTSGFKHGDEVTVKMLLNHMSGIGEWTDTDLEALVYPNIAKIWSVDEFIALAVEQGDNFPPGTNYRYNNTGYNLLGLIIEAVSGKSWRENIETRIFANVSLPNTSLPRPGERTISGDHIKGYQERGGQLNDLTEIDPSMADAAGGHALVSNTEDLSRFLELLIDGKFFKKPETLATMLKAVQTDTPTFRSGYGLGIGKYILHDVTAYGHTGGTGGYSSVVIRVPDKDITISAAFGSENGPAIAALVADTLALALDRHKSQSSGQGVK